MRSKLKILTILIFFVARVFALGQTKVWIEPVPGSDSEKYYVGQTVNLQIRIDTFSEKINGAAFYLTLNTKYIRLVPQNDGKPFLQGTFFSNRPEFNNLHDDSIDNPDLNGIAGLQLDYFQQTDVAVSGDRSYVQGEGVICYFNVMVVGIPENENYEYILGLDDDFFHARESGYFMHELPGQLYNYNFVVPFSMSILGSSIDPPFEKFTIIPGDTFTEYLGDHFYGQDFDKKDAVWSYEILQSVSGVSVDLNTDNDADLFTITTSSNSHGILKLKMIMGIEGSSFRAEQDWEIAVNHLPQFVVPKPTIEILEDVEYNLSLGLLVTDQDDSYENLLISVTGDSCVTASKDGDFLKFLSIQDWNGSTKITLHVSDQYSEEISEELSILVKPVNDDPVITGLDFDTLYIHHDEEKIINLNDIANDVDGDALTWQCSNDPKLDIIISVGKMLIINVDSNYSNFYGSIPITLSVYDTKAGYDTKNIIVEVISYSPEFLPINPILMHADSTRIIDLDDYVSDKDTPLDQITFEFSAIDSTTKITDNNIFLNLNSSSNELTISSVSGHYANDYLEIIAIDEENNRTKIHVILIIASNYAPKFMNIPPIVVYQDSSASLNLNNFVFDVRDNSEDLQLSIKGNDIFKTVSIDAATHILRFESYQTAFGSDTLTLTAENSYGLKDSVDIMAYCIPQDNKPILFDISDLTLYWRRSYDWIDLDNYVFDAFTPDSELVWNINYSDDVFELTVNEDNTTYITTGETLGHGSIELNVMNNDGFSKSASIPVYVQKDTEPVWSSFYDIYMVRTQPNKTMDWTLFEKCADGETEVSDLIFSAQYETNILSVLIDEVSGAVSITVIDTSYDQTTLKFTVKDESQNEVTSQTIDVFIGDGNPPQWKTIPTIYMKNTEVYEKLRLLDYCQDIDDNESDLVFSALSSNVNIDVELMDDSYVRITPNNGIFGENFYVIFKVTDTQENTVQKSVKVIISDDMPPKGFLNYVINPVISTRVDFIVTTDLSVKSVLANFKKLPSTNIVLNFTKMNTSENGFLWNESYKFTEEGSYKLIAELVDDNNIAIYDTTLMTIAFPVAKGAQMSVGTKSLIFEYPEMIYNNKMFFISESDFEKITDNSLAKSTVDQNIIYKKYKLQSGLNANEALFTLRYKPTAGTDRYYSFYKIVDDELVQLETWISDDGEFKAYFSEDCEFCFQKSTFPAKEEIVPENHFICYPNPFNPTVNMKFLLKSPQKVSLQIYNLLGQKIYTDIKEFNPGMNQISWAGIDNSGNIMPSGVYFVMISKNNKPMKIQKVTLFK